MPAATDTRRRDYSTRAPLGARVAFLNADDDRGVVADQVGVVVWVAPDGMFGRDVRLADGREVNVPAYELIVARRPPIVWCEAHNPAGTPVNAATAHPFAAESCVSPHDVGPATREAYIDRLVIADAAARLAQ